MKISWKNYDLRNVVGFCCVSGGLAIFVAAVIGPQAALGAYLFYVGCILRRQEEINRSTKNIEEQHRASIKAIEAQTANINASTMMLHQQTNLLEVQTHLQEAATESVNLDVQKKKETYGKESWE